MEASMVNHVADALGKHPLLDELKGKEKPIKILFVGTSIF